MIKLQRDVICSIRAASCAADLYPCLQKAVELEHSTIPPYLTAMFSLKQGSNQRIAELIRSIVIQEMLHMCIAANILIAIGGRPVINRRAFTPDYPGPLPLNIGDGLQVGIEAFSLALVQNTFMAIEEPEDIIPARGALLAGVVEPGYATIGQFYDALKAQIVKLGPSVFSQTSAPPQVVSAWFPADKLFAITGPESACRAIDIIKREGEGTAIPPCESARDPAHYYRFGEIAAGRALINTPDGHAYAGAPIPFDAAGVWPLRPNCKIADFAMGSPARTCVEQFACHYSALLNAMHDAFNGQPGRLDSAIGAMYDLRLAAVAMMQTDVGDGSGQTVGPSFEYVS